uniref:Uncharacterized protein n=1 Tax=Heterosigma akashiwo TaxID=2829 RepID=A0A7S4DL17_HETAK
MLPPTVRHYLQEFEQELAFEEGLEEGGCNEGKRQEDDEEEERSDFLDDDDDYDRQHDEQVEARDEAQDIIEKIEQASNKMRKEETMAATELSPLSEKRIEEALMMELDLHKSPVRPAEGSVVQVIQVSKEQETSGLNVTENYFRSPAERQGACTVPAYQNTKTNLEKQHSPGIVLDLDNFLLQEFDAECTKKNKHGVIFGNMQGKAGKVKGKNTARSSTKIRADRGDAVVNEQKQPINVDSVQKDCNTTANKDILEAQDYFERGGISLAIALTFLALVMGHCAGSVFLFAVLAVREFYG